MTLTNKSGFRPEDNISNSHDQHHSSSRKCPRTQLNKLSISLVMFKQSRSSRQYARFPKERPCSRSIDPCRSCSPGRHHSRRPKIHQLRPLEFGDLTEKQGQCCMKRLKRDIFVCHLLVSSIDSASSTDLRRVRHRVCGLVSLTGSAVTALVVGGR